MTKVKYIQILKRGWVRNCLALLVVTCILNISIDPPDLHPAHFSENLSVNEIESIVEFALEVVGEIENSVPETEDADHEKFHSHLSSFVSSQKIEVLSWAPYSLITSVIFQSPTQDPAKGILDKVSPPPKFG